METKNRWQVLSKKNQKNSKLNVEKKKKNLVYFVVQKTVANLHEKIWENIIHSEFFTLKKCLIKNINRNFMLQASINSILISISRKKLWTAENKAAN